MRVGSACVLAALLLGGCVTLPGATPPAAAPGPAPCAAYVEYSAAQQADLASAVTELARVKPAGWQVVVGALKDYGALRKTCRAAR
jgi:hypothetical protein